MALIQNFIMIFSAFFALGISVTFFRREKEAKSIRFYLLELGICAFATNIGYVLMSMNPVSELTLWYRNIGMIGIDLYLYVGIRFILSNVDIKKATKNKIEILIILLLCTAVFFHALPEDLTFSSDQYGFTTFVSNHTSGYYLQYAYTLVCSITVFVLYSIWYYKEKRRRGRRFILYIAFATFLLVACNIPAIFDIKSSHPAFFYSFAASLACYIVWLAGIRNSAYIVTTTTLGSDVFGAVNIALLVFDYDGHLAVRNVYAKEMLGIFEVEGQKIGDLFIIDEEELKKLDEELEKNGKAEYRCKAKTGENVYALNAIRKADKYNDLLCTVVSVIDVTAEEEMIKEIIKANEAKSDFLAAMSHEIRTPINAVLGMNELILRESCEANIIGYSEKIEKSGKLLLGLINDVLDFSKVESGKMELVPVNYDITGVINNSVSMIAKAAMDKGLILNLAVDENIPSVLFGDEVRIGQILTNLLSNSVKYTDKGSITVSIDDNPIDEFRTEIIMKVTDTGRGIDEKEIPNLFDAFMRVDKLRNRTIEGSGLGLTLTKTFAEMMDGNVQVDSEYGVGTTFIVTVVQGIVNATPIGNFEERIDNPSGMMRHEGTRLRGEGVKILIVDDLDVNCDVFEGFLKDSMINIDKSYSGMDAIEQCEIERYDLIFMDHMMPEMDGIEAMKEIRSSEFSLNRETPIVVLTANAINGAKEQYLKEGFDDYLAKPLNSSKLDAMIAGILPEKVKIVSASKNEGHTDNEEVREKENAKFIEALEKEVEGIYPRDAIENYAGTSSFYIDMISKYAKSERINVLKEDFEKKDYTDYRINAHTLKGTSKSMGLYSLSEKFEKLQFACDREDYEYINENHENAVYEYGEAVKKILYLLESL